MRVGFVGLGRMGAPMARNLLRAGHTVTVYNRTVARGAALVAEEPAGGRARAAATVAEACEDAEAVVTMLADDAALEAVAFGDGGLLAQLAAGAVHVSMSTVGVALVRRLAAAHAERGQRLVSAPVFGRPEAAAAAKLFVVAAGEPAAVAHVRPLLDAMGQRTFDVGAEPTHANVVKLTGNFMLQSAVASMGEAFAVARAAGIDPHRYLEVLTNSVFSAPFYATYGGMLAADRYEPAGFALRLGLKDVRLALDAAADAGVRMAVGELVRDRFERGLALGLGDQDMAALGRVAAEDGRAG